MNREIHIRSNFAREVELRKLEAEVRADRRPPHILDVLRETLAVHYRPSTTVRAILNHRRL
jgi:hypothetical protein